eukprot:scaffold75853_cov47-Attheya_sp.AAC.1
MSPGFCTRICKTVVSIYSTCAIRCKRTDAWVPKKRRSPPPILQWPLAERRLHVLSYARAHESNSRIQAREECRLPFVVKCGSSTFPPASSLQRPFFPDTFGEIDYKAARSIGIVKGFPTLVSK